jgi:hypothetical protein
MKETLKVVQSVEELVKHVQNSQKTIPVIVCIDGFMGSGKSLLAMELAAKLDGMRVSLDCYADPESDSTSYPEKLKTEYLERDIAKLRSTYGYVVIEGICLLQVLRAVSVTPDIFVYVKRISEHGLWDDGFHLEDYINERAIKENEKGLHKCEFDYHAAILPHEGVDFIFEYVERNAS